MMKIICSCFALKSNAPSILSNRGLYLALLVNVNIYLSSFDECVVWSNGKEQSSECFVLTIITASNLMYRSHSVKERKL